MERAVEVRVRRFASICLLLVTACFPTITHGPRVENGLAFGLTAATTSGDTHTEGDDGVALREGTFGAFIGHGWESTDRRISEASARRPELILMPTS